MNQNSNISVIFSVRFSPFFPHGSIPVPFSPGVTGQSVEGIWQGLKVFESEDIDLQKFEITNMKSIKRSSAKPQSLSFCPMRSPGGHKH